MNSDAKDGPTLGEEVPNWAPPPVPGLQELRGQFVTLAPLDPDDHSESLFQSYLGHDQVWDYLPYGPFASVKDLHAWAEEVRSLPAHQFYAIKTHDTDTWLGVASYLRIAPDAGSIEVGHINFSPALQATREATETMYLMMRWAFEAGYRRYEWKCNALNAASRRAAQRLGFSYEGVFRQATISKGRNRDTAWFAAIDKEWPQLQEAFQTWLAPDNFVDGRQRQSLATLTASVRVASDPSL